jgi:hypothetical protein
MRPTLSTHDMGLTFLLEMVYLLNLPNIFTLALTTVPICTTTLVMSSLSHNKVLLACFLLSLVLSFCISFHSQGGHTIIMA